MAGGGIFPPLAVFQEGSRFWLADGFHRIEATRRTGKLKVMCEVRPAAGETPPSTRQAQMPRTAYDAHSRISAAPVERLLTDAEWSKWSDREIAKRCKVDHHLVGRLRAELSGGASPDTPRLVARGGTTYAMKTAAIGKMKPVPISPLTDAEQAAYQEAFGLESLDAIMSFPPDQQREKMLLGYDAEGRVSPYHSPEPDDASGDVSEGSVAEVGLTDDGAATERPRTQSARKVPAGARIRIVP